MNLEQKMQKWAELKKAVKKLEEEIKQEVLDFGSTVTSENAQAKYSKGRKQVDNKGLALACGATKEQVDHCTTEKITRSTRWAEVVKMVINSECIPQDTIDKFTKKAVPSVSLYLNS